MSTNRISLLGKTLRRPLVKIDADLVVLSTGMIPSKGTEEMVEVMGLSKGPGGFLSEIHGQYWIYFQLP